MSRLIQPIFFYSQSDFYIDHQEVGNCFDSVHQYQLLWIFSKGVRNNFAIEQELIGRHVKKIKHEK